MPKYIKSHSNYVLKKKHQDIYDGTIWERDITTIGGVNQFARGQVPIFKDSNFIITVRDDGKVANQYNRMKWKSNESGDTWTLSDVSGLTSDFEEQNDLKIVLKQDYYDFCDFAYYGSLNELFRSSINDIISRFPGEMYGTDKNAFYTEKTYIDGETYSEDIMLGGEGYKVLLNPFGIDIYSKTKPMDGLDIKYFANEGYKNYVIIKEDGSEEEITGWKPTDTVDPCLVCACGNFNIYWTSTTFPSDGASSAVLCRYSKLSCSNFDITFSGLPTWVKNINNDEENHVVTCDIDPYTSYTEDRTAQIRVNVKLTDGDEEEICDEKVFEVNQSKRTCSCGGAFLNLNRSIHFGKDREESRLCTIGENDCYIINEIDYTVTDDSAHLDGNWITVDYSERDIYVHVDENNGRKRSAVLEITLPMQNGNNCTASGIRITQDGCDCENFINQIENTIPIDGLYENALKIATYPTTGCVAPISFCETSSDWITITRYENGEIYIKADRNVGGERNGYVNVGSDHCDEPIKLNLTQNASVFRFVEGVRKGDYNRDTGEYYFNIKRIGYSQEIANFDSTRYSVESHVDGGSGCTIIVSGGTIILRVFRNEASQEREWDVTINFKENGAIVSTIKLKILQDGQGSECINLISGSNLTFDSGENEGIKIAEICDGVSCMVDVEEESWMGADFSSSTNEVYLNLSKNFKERKRSNKVYIKITDTNGEFRKTINIYQDPHVCSCEEIKKEINVGEDFYKFDAIPCTDTEGEDWCLLDIPIADYDKSEYSCPQHEQFCCNYGVFPTAEGTDWFEYETYQIDDDKTGIKLSRIKKNYSTESREGKIIIVPLRNGFSCVDDVIEIPIIQSGNTSTTINSLSSTSRKLQLFGSKNINLTKANDNEPPKTKRLSIVRISGTTSAETTNEYTIGVYLGDNNEIVYLSQDTKNIHIRPKQEFLDKFYNECDNFERLLLNPKTTPKYKAIFSVINENDKGYYRKMEEFVFPTSEGGYNLDASSYGFTDYTTRLSEIGTYYDGYFTDNLYRSMTHEAIKNFDWSFTREFIGEGEEEYTHGGEKIQKALRIFAREFDEILSYINNIKNNGRITYDERSNIPNYFLIDEAEDCGWDVCVTYPYDLVEYKVSGNSKSEVEDYNEDTQLSGYTDGKLVRNFSHNPSSKIYPYSESHISGTDISDYDRGGYFVVCDGSGDEPCYYHQTGSSIYSYISASGSGTTYYDKSLSGTPVALKNRIKTYSDEKEYTYFDANNEFIRRLRINSPYIWRHKGTIEGIEMLLSLFGMKSKRWVDNMNEKGCSDYEYDYDITEYSSFTPRIEEQWDAEHQMYRIDWINSTKAIVYDYRQTSNYTRYGANQSNYVSYQGLPIAFRDEYIINVDDTLINKPYIKIAEMNTCSGQGATNESGEAFTRMDTNELVRRRYLYPNFSKTEQLDGNPYFQMSGGWLSKTVETSGDITSRYNFQFDVDDNIAYTEYISGGTYDDDGTIIDNHPIYKETVRNIKRVDNIAQLVSTPSFSVEDGTIYYVSNIERDAAIINGEVYTINYEYGGDGNDNLRYVVLTKNGGYISIGDDLFFDNVIMVYDKNGSATTYDVSDKPEGFDIKAYIIKEDGQSKFMCQADADGYYTIDGFCVLDEALSESGMTNYFIIDDAYYSTRMYCGSGDSGGWRALRESDPEYIRINTITNYYEGNNPHNGNMVYDGGHEYFTYYKRLFKYAIDNSLFDERCYESFFIDLDNEISKIGFHGLIDDNEMIRQYYPFMNEDSKIHYFGTYYKRDEMKYFPEIDLSGYCETNVSFYGENEEKAKKLKGMYQSTVNSEISVKNYILSDDALIGGSPYPSATTYNCSITDDEGEEHLIPISAKTDEVTNQIVNNKRLTITFYLHDTWYSNRGQCELKYIDDIVMNYLTQMVPSTSIVDVRCVGENNA